MTLRRKSRLVSTLIIGWGVLLILIFPASLPDNSALLEKGFKTPIIAFEFVETKAEVKAVFDGAAPGYREGMKLGNILDYIYMLLYGSLLFLVAGMLLQKSAWLRPTRFLAVAAPLFDGLENVMLFLLQADNEASEYILWLRIFTWGKWLALALIFLIFSLQARVESSEPGRRAIWPMKAIWLLCLPAAIVAFVRPGAFTELFSATIMLSFIAAMVFVWLPARKQPDLIA